MPKLPEISADQAVQAFEKAGFVVKNRGNHITMSRPGHRFTLAIPNKRKLARGTLASLIQDAGLTREEFLALLA